MYSILNKITLDNFESQSELLIDVGISSVEILEGVITRIFQRAVTAPKFVAMYATLCRKISDSKKVTSFPSTSETDPKDIVCLRFSSILATCLPVSSDFQESVAQQVSRRVREQPSSCQKTSKKGRIDPRGNLRIGGEGEHCTQTLPWKYLLSLLILFLLV